MSVNQVLIGMKGDDARVFARKNGMKVRIVKADGKRFVVTSDHVPNRVNVEIEGDVIVKVNGNG